jgi:hypothetical protein
MAERKYGKINKMKTRFQDYNYIINGEGGVGKTSLAHQLGKEVTDSDEGTFIITLGGEPAPEHIPNAFGDVAKDFKTFMSIVKELCDNKEAYPDTVFVALDSLDEYARITEEYVIKEWNAQCDINERAKSIKQAYKGYQGGENRACTLMIEQVLKLQNAGYKMLEIGHTKVKTKDDPLSDVKYEQLTCNLDNKYYNAMKDKVNLVAMCAFENNIENVEERKNAFTKKMEKVGKLQSRTRVMIFEDNDVAIDTKTHFEYITPKIELGARNFIEAVESAIAMKLEEVGEAPAKKKNTTTKKSTKKAPVVEEEHDEEEDDLLEQLKAAVESVEEDNTPPFDTEEEIDDIFSEEETVDEDAMITLDADRLTAIRNAFKGADASAKAKVKTHLTAYGNKLSDSMLQSDVLAIEEILGLNDEV